MSVQVWLGSAGAGAVRKEEQRVGEAPDDPSRRNGGRLHNGEASSSAHPEGAGGSGRSGTS